MHSFATSLESKAAIVLDLDERNMADGKKSRRGLKICCGVTTIFLLVILVVSVILSLTVFKPKQPEITAKPLGLENIDLQIIPVVSLNVTVSMMVTIENRNYGSFKYTNSTAYFSYHGATVAEIPIEPDTVPARGQTNTTSTVEIMGDKLVSSPYFWADVATGTLNLTSSATLHGRVSVFKVLKLHATAFSTCDISVFIQSRDFKVTCKSKVKL